MNAVYSWCVERVENKEEFDTDLFAPLAGRPRAVTAEVVRDELDAFSAFASALGG